MSGLNSFSTKSSLVKIGLQKQLKPMKVMVMGQTAVGKSAMVVRYITKRYIGEYDSSEHIYNFTTTVDNETINFEILDSSVASGNEASLSIFESNIRWAEAFVLVYSVTDKCSFQDVNRLKFLINYNKRRRRNLKDWETIVPVVLVGNKSDQFEDRMVTTKEGFAKCAETSCAGFREISTRESIEDVCEIFAELIRHSKIITKSSKQLKRSKSDSIRLSLKLRPESETEIFKSIFCQKQLDESKTNSNSLFGRSKSVWPEDDEERHDEFDETDLNLNADEPFRSRAKTDGNLFVSRPRKWKIPSQLYSPPEPAPIYKLSSRRNSISLQGQICY